MRHLLTLIIAFVCVPAFGQVDYVAERNAKLSQTASQLKELAADYEALAEQTIISMPELPRSPGTIHTVNDADGLRAALTAPSPKTIVIDSGVKRIHLEGGLRLGGFTGNDGVSQGTDVTIIGNSCALTGRGITIERNCNRVLVYDLAIYPGNASAAGGKPKAWLSDPITLVGYSALDRKPARNITFRNCAFGFGPDMNFQSEGKSIALIDCLSFYGLASPDHPKPSPPHSKAAYFVGNEFLKASGDRLPVIMIGCGMAFCDDRAPRIGGSIDYAQHGCWQVGIRMGANVTDHHTKDGYPRMTFTWNRFTTAMLQRPRQVPVKTDPWTITLGTQSESRLHMANNYQDGVLYQADSMWTIASQQAGFGGAFAGTKVPESNRSLRMPPVIVAGVEIPMDAMDHVANKAGTKLRDKIQTHVLAEMAKCAANPGKHEFSLMRTEADLTIDGQTGFCILGAE